MSAHVTVAIVNWNGREFLGDCLRAVLTQRYDGEIVPVVVDNGSTDGSQDYLAREFPAVAFVQHGQNNYAAANNLVAARAREFVLLLNTDATLDPDCVATLVAALRADARAAAAAPKILYPDGSICTTGIAERDDLYWVDRDQRCADDGAAGPPERVFGVSGCCALFRTEAWREVGGQDESFHMYYEDVDLALALRAAGWHSLYVPAARCVHIGHGSIVKASTWKDELGERNRLLVLARHHRDRFARELVRSPWFQAAAPDAVRALLPLCARRLRDVEGGGGDEPGDVALLLDLLLALRDEVRGLAGELDARWGEHRNLPKILDERERWIGILLREVARLRVWRLPGRRLKPDERAFLDRLERRERDPRTDGR